MQIKLGSLNVDIEVEGHTDQSVLDLTLRELTQSRIVVSFNQSAQAPTPRSRAPAAVKAVPRSSTLELLNQMGFTKHTIAMVSKKILGIKTSGNALERDIDKLDQAASKWGSRKITDKIWGLFITPIETANLGKHVLAVGISKDNHLVILGGEPAPEDLYESLVDRGVERNKITFALVSAGVDADEVAGHFPKAKIQRDWQDFIDAAKSPEDKEMVRNAMYSSDASLVKPLLRRLKAPKELLTYMEFDPHLWRALRRSPVERIAKEYAAKVRQFDSESDARKAASWAAIRLQYYWYKTSVHGEALKHLKFIEARLSPA